MNFIILLLIVFAITTIHAKVQCGSGVGNCNFGLCCSKNGKCGVGNSYCGSGCQKKYGVCYPTFPLFPVYPIFPFFPTTTTKKKTTTKTTTSTTTTTKSTTTISNTPVSTPIEVFHECLNDNHWALTFDDGPYIYDEALLDYLKSKNVKATFFINGNTYLNIRSDQGRRIVKRLYEEGHTIASHTYNHIDLTAHTIEEIIEEITQLEIALKEIIGVKPTFIRPPYGRGAYEDPIPQVLESLGYTGIIMWNVDPADWENLGDTDYAIAEMKKVVDNGGPLIIVNHNRYDNMTQESLLNSAKAEIEYMESNGYTAVPMSECIGRNPYK